MIKKLFMFLLGLGLLAITAVIVFVTGALYDTAQKQTVELYFFQPQRSQYHRPGTPQSLQDLGDDKVLDMLIRLYVTEYFYILPDTNDINNRQTLKLLSSSGVLANWTENVAPDLQELAGHGVLRTIQVTDILPYDDYYEVHYNSTTWSVPNDMAEVPTTAKSVVMLKVRYNPGLAYGADQAYDYTGVSNLHHHLETGGDPARAFMFKVFDVVPIIDWGAR